ncbi:MAG TPA: hypothetical protein VKV37_19595 [Ktedonobacteraceae bacterium]|jgi:hypothetical protein|nr:hypothetical protein [Ktedonobacteraceae bacterium]
MSRRSRLLITVCPLLLLALLAGCEANGQQTTGATIPSANATFQGTPGVIPAQTQTITLPGKPAATVPPTATPRGSVPTANGPVTLSVNASSYQAGDAIIVTLRNQSARPIAFPDHLTDCSVVLLQQQVGINWQPVDLCRSMIMSKLHTLAARQNLIVQLMPPTQWSPGTYRCRVSYASPGNSGLMETVFSAQFQIA